MKTLRPDNTDPIPLRTLPPRLGIIIIRFIVLLTIVVLALALAWSR